MNQLILPGSVLSKAERDFLQTDFISLNNRFTDSIIRRIDIENIKKFISNIGPWDIELNNDGFRVKLRTDNAVNFLKDVPKPVRKFISDVYEEVTAFYCPLDRLKDVVYYDTMENKQIGEKVKWFLIKREDNIIKNGGRNLEKELCHRIGV